MKLIKKERKGYNRKITILNFIKVSYKGKSYVGPRPNDTVQECKINISEKLVKDVIEFSKDCTKDIDNKLLNSYINLYLNIPIFMDRINSVFEYFNDINENTKILEIGSGIGTSCLCAKELTNAQLIGVEPAPLSYSLLHNCIKSFKEANPSLEYNLLTCGGENIPLEDESIDYICSFEVLEHVQDPYKVLSEIYRLLKKGGRAYISTCNYDSFYEGHYKTFWNPFVSVKKNKQNFIKKGFSPKFLNELNFITKNKIIQYVNKIGFSKLEFDPAPLKPARKLDLHVQISDNAKKLIPTQGRAIKPVWLASLIEKPKIHKFLKKFNREYKLYFIIEK